MAKKKKKGATFGKLLDAWSPPEGAGFSVGCIATTFTFNPVFFEEECLGRFLQMQSNAVEDGPVYIIEREEKLADIRCASVLVDVNHCKGQRSLRWDLLAAKVPAAILHAKVSLLWWQKCVRLIVASANLTEDGYRRNREIYGIVDYTEGSSTTLLFLDDVLIFLREAASYAEAVSDEPSPALSRWQGFLGGIFETTRGWGTADDPKGKKTTRVYAILTGPGRPSAFEQISSVWPEGSPPIDAIVTSPFFDPPGAPNSPAKELWKSLRQRGEASVTYNVTAEEVEGDSKLFVHAPREMIDAQPNRPSVDTYIVRIQEQEEDKSGVHRPIHMKGICFSGADWLAYMIGSENFTSRGLGLSRRPNLEAGMLYLASESGNPAVANRLREAIPDGEFLDDDDTLLFQPKTETGEDAPDDEIVSLPQAFGQAVYARDGDDAKIQFHFVDTPPAGWQVFKSEGSDEVLLSEAHWSAKGQPEKIIVAWNLGMAPSGFEVNWDTVNGRAWWPVNVDRAASLPPPEELNDLPLEILINILTSARPLYQVIKDWVRKKKKKGPEDPVKDPYDPHKRVDTSAFLLQKTYRVSSALSGLRSRLERPVVSKDSLEWRLKGPVGVYAVAKAITKEARSDDELVFLITELVLEVLRSQPQTTPGYLPTETVINEIKIVALDLKNQTFEKLEAASSSMAEYVKAAFRGILP